MTDDIVARLRFNATQFGKMCKPGARTSIDPEFILQLCEDWRFAADRIEQLQAENATLRRRVADREAEIVDRALGFTRDISWDPKSSERIRCERYAAERGFTCFGLNGGPGMEREQ